MCLAADRSPFLSATFMSFHSLHLFSPPCCCQECEVLEVCLAAQDAERRDIPASVAAESAVGDPARDLRLVHWVRTARAVLVATQV